MRQSLFNLHEIIKCMWSLGGQVYGQKPDLCCSVKMTSPRNDGCPHICDVLALQWEKVGTLHHLYFCQCPGQISLYCKYAYEKMLWSKLCYKGHMTSRQTGRNLQIPHAGIDPQMCINYIMWWNNFHFRYMFTVMHISKALFPFCGYDFIQHTNYMFVDRGLQQFVQ